MALNTNPNEMLDWLADLLKRALADEAATPVLPYRSEAELGRGFDLAIPEQGQCGEAFRRLLEQVVFATPRTATRAFFNQLFGGRNWPATVADMLASFLNSSMYTFKVAGIHVLIEREVIGKMCAHVGFRDGDGAFAPGGSISNLVAMLLARNQKDAAIRDAGLSGRAYRVYTSVQSHYSIIKNAGILGLGRENVRKIAVDDRGRMKPDAVREAIRADRDAGHAPLMINATAGTTVLGAYDPIRALADAAAETGVWLHVDGAWGGTALLSPEMRCLLAGCERADSFTWDAHKMMGVPLVASALLVREKGLLQDHLSEHASYLFQTEEEELNPGMRSIQCGRRNDAFKVWAAWQCLGDAGYAARTDRLRELALYAADRVKAHAGMTLLMEPESMNVCFKVHGACSEALCEAMDQRGLAKIGYGRFGGESYIRFVSVDPDRTEADIDALLDELLRVAATL